MEATGKLTTPDWMADPETAQVMTALGADSGRARFVGGCVRDSLLGRPVLDIDICTVLTPDEVVEKLKMAGIKAVPTGIEHGTVTAVVDGSAFEVTTLRRDVETDGRHAKVEFTTKWEEDAARRDFTLNALYCDMDGRVYDPTGEGLEDLREGRIRFIGDAVARIEEDYLRILRFFRFHARYGKTPPDEQALAACREKAARIEGLSAERVRDELLKILGVENPAPVWSLMAENGVLAHALPEARNIGKLEALVRVENATEFMDEGIRGGDGLRRLAALLEKGRAEALAVAARLKLSNAQRDRLAGLKEPDDAARADASAEEARRALYGLGREMFLDMLMLRAAEEGLSGEEENLCRIAAQAHSWKKPEFPVRGRDARRLGAQPGPKLGKALRLVEQWWLENDFIPNRDACLKELEKALAAG